jgi:hypothetical protein
VIDNARILDVVTPAPSQDLVSLTDTRDEFDAPRTADARLKRYITEASAAVATYTRRVWRQETVTETFYSAFFMGGWGAWGWGWGWRWSPYRRSDGAPNPLVLARYPVSSIISVVADGTAFDPTEYLLDGDKGLLYRWDPDGSIGMAWAAQTVAITYVSGYQLTADVPPDVQQACMAMIRQRYFSRGRNPYLRSQTVPNVQEESYWAGPDLSALPPETIGLLDRHIDMRS